MQLRYSFRLYPTSAQQQALARAFGCARVVFNDALPARKAAHEAGEPYLTDAEMSRRLTASKGDPARAWLGEVSSVVLQQALADLNTAYRNFFASVTGKRKGPKVAPPRFRSRKDSRQAVRFTRNRRFAVRMPLSELGRRAIEMIATRAPEDDITEIVTDPVEVILRNSTAPPGTTPLSERITAPHLLPRVT